MIHKASAHTLREELQRCLFLLGYVEKKIDPEEEQSPYLHIQFALKFYMCELQQEFALRRDLPASLVDDKSRHARKRKFETRVPADEDEYGVRIQEYRELIDTRKRRR